MQNLITGALVGSLITLYYNHRSNEIKNLRSDLSLLKIIHQEMNINKEKIEMNMNIISSNFKQLENGHVVLSSLVICHTGFWDLFNKLTNTSLQKTQEIMTRCKRGIDYTNGDVEHRNAYKMHCFSQRDFLLNLRTIDDNVFISCKLTIDTITNDINELNIIIKELQNKIDSFLEVKIKQFIFRFFNIT